MERRKRFAIVTEDGYTFATGNLDEKEALRALGYEVEEEETALPDLEDVKYEQIEFVRGKATDMSVFMRYINQGSFIDAAAVVRIKLGNSMLDFYIYNLETLKTVERAIRRCRYRMQKIEAVNRKTAFGEIQRAYRLLNGTTLSEIVENGQLRNSQSENEAD